MDVGVTQPNLFFLVYFSYTLLVGLVGLEENISELVSDLSNSTEKEIIIDVPLALSIMTSGFFWPVSAWQELVSGDLIATDDTITTSPR